MSLGRGEDIFSPTNLAAVDGAVAAAERAWTTAFAANGDEGGLECLGVHQVRLAAPVLFSAPPWPRIPPYRRSTR